MIKDTRSFKFLKHTADAYVMAYGKDINEVFENSALAMFEVMTNTITIKKKIEDEICIETEDKLSLLFLWLESILIKFDIERKLYSEFLVNIKKNKNYCLKAKIWGEYFDPSRHPSKTEVKAITYHRMKIGKYANRIYAKFILDI